MPNQKTDHENLTLEDLMRAESEVLDRIASEIETEPANVIAGHSSHASGHTSSGGHYSSVARVEGLDPATADKPETPEK